MSRRIAAILLLIAFGWAGSGCAIRFQRQVFNAPLHADQVDFIIPGQTTMHEVVDRLGAPQELDATENRTVFRYEYYDRKQMYIDFGQLIGLAAGLRFSPELSAQHQDSGSGAFQVSFNGRWVVEDYAFQRGAGETRFNFWPF